MHKSVTVKLHGRIDELDEVSTHAAMVERVNDYSGTTITGWGELDYLFACLEARVELAAMFVPLGLTGSWMVTGIEGKHYNGYVPGPDNDLPWPLVVEAHQSAFDLMQAVAGSEANGYPDSNHVYFESLTITPATMSLNFSMGS
jgi:hypothetical protein